MAKSFILKTTFIDLEETIWFESFFKHWFSLYVVNRCLEESISPWNIYTIYRIILKIFWSNSYNYLYSHFTRFKKKNSLYILLYRWFKSDIVKWIRLVQNGELCLNSTKKSTFNICTTRISEGNQKNPLN
jgi:hypothetical protein